eukprot:364430-Chlamydomonas_euryale.AAC.4
MAGKAPNKLDADGGLPRPVKRVPPHVLLRSSTSPKAHTSGKQLSSHYWHEYDLHGDDGTVRQAKCLAKNTTVPCADCPTKVIINFKTAAERRDWVKELGDFGFPSLSKAAMRLLSMHATLVAAERFNSTCGAMYTADPLQPCTRHGRQDGASTHLAELQP